MPAQLSIVMPTLNAADRLGPVLGALKPGLDIGLIRELVISDGGSSDATEEIAEEVGATWISGPRGRGGQLLRGAEVARGDWLLFLHSDTVLSENWANEVRQHLNTQSKAGHFRLRFEADEFAPRFVEAWVRLRVRVFGLPYGDQGLLISRELYDRVGGFSDMPLMEDVDLAGRLRGRLVALDAVAMTGADRYLQVGWLRQGSRNLWRLVRFKCGVPVTRLMGDYDPSN